MSRKNNLRQFSIISSGNMASSITSAVTNIQWLDNIGIQADFSGSPVGTLAIQVSANYAQDDQGNVTNPGTWITISSSSMTSSPLYFDLNQLSAPWIRALYTPSSGSGTLNVLITAKML